MDELIGDSDEEDENEEDEGENEKDEKVYSASIYGSGKDDDDDDDDDDAQGGTGLKGELIDRGAGDAQNVQQAQKLILRLDTYREEGENIHTYTLEAIKEMTRLVNPDFKFDFEEELNAEFEEELNAFDINQQLEYEYRYVEEADMYDRVENRDELRRKVAEILKDVNFDSTPKDMSKEERKKWFKESHERKFKWPLKYYQRDRSISLGDIISWGFLLQINAYAIRRECGRLEPWDILLGRTTLLWGGLIKFEALRNFKHCLNRVTRRDPVTGVEETILNVKKPKTMKTIPVPSMEQEFYIRFMGWVYSCITTEVVITYRAGSGLREIHVYDPKWLVNCPAKDIECLFINKIHYQPEDKEQATQFQLVAALCFKKSINSESK
ncbi:hypothetical protein Hanom_Chr16g01427211 [Helianthus anomalus]